ncbi:MAG: outer membrane protein assembly factor BamA [Puniceicoccales bacterium]|nr:outer membrane protein assembly factor BamA [Puniceicoccales bacterium]
MESRFRGFGKLFFAVLLAGTLPLSAEELTVGKVEMRIQGAATVGTDAVFSRIKLKEGEPFLQEKNDDSIRALYATHLFDLVEVITENGISDGHIDVVYVLHPKQRVAKVSFEGNRHISNKRLRKLVEVKDGGALDHTQVQKDVEAILDLYRSRGHADVAVAVRCAEAGNEEPQDLVYAIGEGARLPIGKINFSGNSSVPSRVLRKLMVLHRRTLFSFLSGSGNYRPRQLEDDLEKLRGYYHNLGFLDVRILAEDAILDRKSGNSLLITIPIIEGPRFKVGEVTFFGNTLYDNRRLEKLLQVHSGDYFSPDRVDQTVESLRYFYGRGGHIDSYVTAQRRANIANNSIDLTFAVRESPLSRVGMVNIQGNTKTKNSVILRELSLFPGDKFDLIKLRNSENRLRETRYFRQVTLVPEATEEPEIRNVAVNVEEEKTGKFSFGGALSSFDNIVGYVEFSQSNADIFNRNAHFQGAGQKFRSRVEVGTRTSQLLLSLGEPWLYNRELAFGTDIFATRSEYKKSDYNYDGATYNERHGGFESYFRKRIVELLEGRLYYRLDNAKLYDVGPQAPRPLKEQEAAGAQWISKVGLSLQRDSRDSLLYPTVGNRVILALDYAGLGGNIHYLNLDLQGGQWFKVANWHTQTLALIGKIGTIKGFGSEPIPYFDRKFLGGVGDMRGFGGHAVGPRDPYCGEALGARTYAYGCGEYSFRFTDSFRMAFFGEAARVGLNYMRLKDPIYLDAGVEFRIFVMGSPLRLIFGYPLHGDRYTEYKVQFNFTFGSVF